MLGEAEIITKLQARDVCQSLEPDFSNFPSTKTSLKFPAGGRHECASTRAHSRMAKGLVMCWGHSALWKLLRPASESTGLGHTFMKFQKPDWSVCFYFPGVPAPPSYLHRLSLCGHGLSCTSLPAISSNHVLFLLPSDVHLRLFAGTMQRPGICGWDLTQHQLGEGLERVGDTDWRSLAVLHSRGARERSRLRC